MNDENNRPVFATEKLLRVSEEVEKKEKSRDFSHFYGENSSPIYFNSWRDLQQNAQEKTIAKFRSSPAFVGFKSQVKAAIDGLKAWTSQNIEGREDEKERYVKKWEKLHNLFLNGLSDDIATVYYSDVKAALEQIYFLLYSEGDEEKKKEIIKNFIQSDPLEVCAPGVAENISDLRRALSANPEELIQSAVSKSIQQHALEFINKNGLVDYKGNETHIVVPFYNGIAEIMGLPVREDPYADTIFAEDAEHFTPDQLEKMPEKISKCKALYVEKFIDIFMEALYIASNLEEKIKAIKKAHKDGNLQEKYGQFLSLLEAFGKDEEFNIHNFLKENGDDRGTINLSLELKNTLLRRMINSGYFSENIIKIFRTSLDEENIDEENIIELSVVPDSFALCSVREIHTIEKKIEVEQSIFRRDDNNKLIRETIKRIVISEDIDKKPLQSLGDFLLKPKDISEEDWNELKGPVLEKIIEELENYPDKTKSENFLFNLFSEAISKKHTLSINALRNKIEFLSEDQKNNLLFMGIEQGCLDVVNLFSTSENINIVNKDNLTQIEWAFLCNAPESIKACLKNNGHTIKEDKKNAYYLIGLLKKQNKNFSIRDVNDLLNTKKLKIDLNIEYRGKTPMEWAIQNEHAEAITKISRYDKAHKGTLTNQYNELLFAAIKNGKTKAIAPLLSAGANDVYYYHEHETKEVVEARSPLHDAIRKNNLAIVKELIGHNPNLKNEYKNPPFIPKFFYNAWNILKFFKKIYIKSHKAEILDFKYPRGDTALYQAIKYRKDILIISYLLEQGADMEIKGSDSLTPLYMAILTGNNEAAKILIEKGARTSLVVSSLSVSQNEESALGKMKENDQSIHIAIRTGNRYIVKMLLDKNPDLLNSGKPSLYVALKELLSAAKNNSTKEAIEKRSAIIKILVDRGAGLSSGTRIGKSGLTPLHVLALAGNLEEAAENILKNHPKWLETEDNFGKTPLSLAVENNNVGLVKLLLEKQANIIKHHLNYLHLPEKLEIAKAFIDRNPNVVKVKTCQGKTLLELAFETNNRELVEFVRSKEVLPDNDLVCMAAKAGNIAFIGNLLPQSREGDAANGIAYILESDLRNNQKRQALHDLYSNGSLSEEEYRKSIALLFHKMDSTISVGRDCLFYDNVSLPSVRIDYNNQSNTNEARVLLVSH